MALMSFAGIARQQNGGERLAVFAAHVVVGALVDHEIRSLTAGISLVNAARLDQRCQGIHGGEIRSGAVGVNDEIAVFCADAVLVVAGDLSRPGADEDPVRTCAVLFVGNGENVAGKSGDERRELICEQILSGICAGGDHDTEIIGGETAEVKRFLRVIVKFHYVGLGGVSNGSVLVAGEAGNEEVHRLGKTVL